MKKTLIAMAVAGVVAAPVQADIGGSLGMGILSGDVVDQVYGILVLNMNNEVMTDSGMTVYGNLSLSYDSPEPGNFNGAFAFTGLVVGIKGDFGNVHIGDGGSGVHLAQFAGDRFDVSQGGRYRHAIGYTGNFGGITVRATQDPNDGGPAATTDEDYTTFGIKGTFAGVEVGFGQEDEDTTIGARYGMGDWSFAVHSTEWDDATIPVSGSDDSSIALKVGWSGGMVSASFQTEELNDRTKSQIDAAYNLGGGAAVKLRIRMDDVDSGEYTRLLLTVGF